MSDTNHIGLTKADYAGSKTTLCLGCGHDQITREIIQAVFLSGLFVVVALMANALSDKATAGL